MQGINAFVTSIALTSLLVGCASEVEDIEEASADVASTEEADADTLEELINESNLIVEATFAGEEEQVAYGESNEHTNILYKLEVHDVIAGDEASDIQIVYLTGSAAEELEEGRYLLFLDQTGFLAANTEEGNFPEQTYYIYGLGQGAFPISAEGELEYTGESDTFTADFAENTLEEAIAEIEDAL